MYQCNNTVERVFFKLCDLDFYKRYWGFPGESTQRWVGNMTYPRSHCSDSCGNRCQTTVLRTPGVTWTYILLHLTQSFMEGAGKARFWATLVRTLGIPGQAHGPKLLGAILVIAGQKDAGPHCPEFSGLAGWECSKQIRGGSQVRAAKFTMDCTAQSP